MKIIGSSKGDPGRSRRSVASRVEKRIDESENLVSGVCAGGSGVLDNCLEISSTSKQACRHPM